MIVKLQTSRRFVSSSNHHSHSHRGILYTLPSHVGPELCVRSQESEAGQSVGWWRTCNYHNCYILGSQSRGIMNHSANKVMRLTPSLALAGGCTWLGLDTAEVPSRPRISACCIVGGIRYRCIHAAVIAADVPRRPPQFLRVAGNRDSPCRHMAAGAGDH